jgi:hypothetical protein
MFKNSSGFLFALWVLSFSGPQSNFLRRIQENYRLFDSGTGSGRKVCIVVCFSGAMSRGGGFDTLPTPIYGSNLCLSYTPYSKENFEW